MPSKSLLLEKSWCEHSGFYRLSHVRIKGLKWCFRLSHVEHCTELCYLQTLTHK